LIDFSLIATLAIDPNKLSTSTYPINSGSANAATPNTGAIEADTAFKHVKRKPIDLNFAAGTLFYSDANSTDTPDLLSRNDCFKRFPFHKIPPPT